MASNSQPGHSESPPMKEFAQLKAFVLQVKELEL
jgi:hypothetical protein